MKRDTKRPLHSQNHLSFGVVLFCILLMIGGLLYGLTKVPKNSFVFIQGGGDGGEEYRGFPSVPTEVQMTESDPVRLRIPRIELETSFLENPLGLTERGEVAVPDDYTRVGWYGYGPTPGEFGPAVVLGHVDSYRGPAVFFSLGELEPGDSIFVDREDGTTAHFTVTRLERPSQEAFPTEEVYGNIEYAGLRLITCSGIYLRGEARYTHNLIVYAELTESMVGG